MLGGAKQGRNEHFVLKEILDKFRYDWLDQKKNRVKKI